VRVASLGLPEVLAEAAGFQDVGQVCGGGRGGRGGRARRGRQAVAQPVKWGCGPPNPLVFNALGMLLVPRCCSPGHHAPPPAPLAPPPTQLQRGDLAALGNLVLLLACVGRGVPPSLDYLTAHFSRELCHVVAGLLASAEGARAAGGAPRLLPSPLASLGGASGRQRERGERWAVPCQPGSPTLPLAPRLQAAASPAGGRC
jgi:hypothetical protein